MAREPTVVVVGAGIGGICVWDHLRRAGCRTVLLDAGPATISEDQLTPGFVPEEETWRYAGIDDGDWIRVLAVGGRANVWGRWCGRFSNDVFERWGWPLASEAMTGAYDQADAWLNTISDPVPERYAMFANEFAGQLTGRTSAHAQASPWLDALSAARGHARTNTVALRLHTDATRALELEVATEAGSETLVASHFVLAASPFETVRILLASGARHPGIGCGLTDHVTAGFRLIDPRPRTSGSEAALIRTGAYTIEMLGPIQLNHATAEFLSAHGVPVEPGMSEYAILGLGEQTPRPQQRMTLDLDERDRLGRPRPRFEAVATDEDQRLASAMRRDALKVIRGLQREGMKIVELPSSVEMPRVFHPSGGVIMGHGREHPADCSGRLREWNNVWIADASVFASAGDCHPTLTIAALARCVAACILGGK